MIGGDKVIAQAKKHLGQNGGFVWKAFGNWGTGWDWCVGFVRTIMQECGYLSLFCDSVKTAYVPYAYNWLRANCQKISVPKAKAGDIVIFDFGGAGGLDHIGFVIEPLSSSQIRTIEGNTENRDVAMCIRNAQNIVGIWRPKYPTAAAPKKAQQVPGRAVNNEGIQYRAYVQSLGWCAQVHDGQTAGTVGFGKRLEALQIETPAGILLNVDIHLEHIGWHTFKNVGKSNPVMGAPGHSLRIEAVRINSTLNSTGKSIQYRVHVQDKGWLDWKNVGEIAGTTGESRRVEAIQIKLV